MRRNGKGAKRRNKNAPLPLLTSPEPTSKRPVAQTEEVATTEKPTKKRRNTNPLSEEHAHQLRCRPETLLPTSRLKNPRTRVLPATSARAKAQSAAAGRAAWKEVREAPAYLRGREAPPRVPEAHGRGGYESEAQEGRINRRFGLPPYCVHAD